MTLIVAICVAVIFGVSMFLLLGNGLKVMAMGVFLMSHAAHLSILAMSGSPLRTDQEQPPMLVSKYEVTKSPPVIPDAEIGPQPLLDFVDPLPQALILTAIVISFAVMAFLLTLLVVTARATKTVDVDELAREGRPTPSTAQ